MTVEREKEAKIISTSFQFRVALLLSEHEAIYSEPSVDISTNEDGIPDSPPIIELVGTVDQTRIMVSWKAGNKNNGPILSYKLEIRDLTQPGYYAVKVEITCYLFCYDFFCKINLPISTNLS